MTTVEERLTETLLNRGLFENQAKIILEKVKADKINESMTSRWTDQAEDYPPLILNILWLSTTDHALEWIKENAPNAWYRPLFEDKKDDK